MNSLIQWIHLHHNKWIHVINEFIYAIQWIHSNNESIVLMNSFRPANHSPLEASPGYCHWKIWHHCHQHWYTGGRTIMEQLVSIFAWEYKIMLAILPWTITPAAGGEMTVVACTKVSAMVNDDRVGRAEAATVSLGKREQTMRKTIHRAIWTMRERFLDPGELWT